MATTNHQTDRKLETLWRHSSTKRSIPTGRQVADTLVAPDRAAAIEQLFGKSLSPVSIERQDEHHAGRRC